MITPHTLIIQRQKVQCSFIISYNKSNIEFQAGLQITTML